MPAIGGVLARRRLRRVEQALALSRELRNRYDALQSVTREGVLVQSLSSQVLDISERAADILRVDPAQTVGRSVGDLPVVMINERGMAMNPTAVLSVGTRPGDTPLVVGVTVPGMASAPVRLVQVAGRVVPHGDGDAPAVLTTLVDVTGLVIYFAVAGMVLHGALDSPVPSLPGPVAIRESVAKPAGGLGFSAITQSEWLAPKDASHHIPVSIQLRVTNGGASDLVFPVTNSLRLSIQDANGKEVVRAVISMYVSPRKES